MRPRPYNLFDPQRERKEAIEQAVAAKIEAEHHKLFRAVERVKNEALLKHTIEAKRVLGTGHKNFLRWLAMRQSALEASLREGNDER